MVRNPSDSVLQHLRVILAAKEFEHVSDAELLRRLVHGCDETAFTVLVRRHGGRVLAVCRHLLRQEADAEDAFQATFLILARKAASIRKQKSLASWLHGVAVRSPRRKALTPLPDSSTAFLSVARLQFRCVDCDQALPGVSRGWFAQLFKKR